MRRCDLDVDDLYRRQGVYEYSGGVNYRALVALGSGIIVALLGLVVPWARWLYDYAWFVGFLVSSVTYWIAMRNAIRNAPPAADYAYSVLPGSPGPPSPGEPL